MSGKVMLIALKIENHLYLVVHAVAGFELGQEPLPQFLIKFSNKN